MWLSPELLPERKPIGTRICNKLYTVSLLVAVLGMQGCGFSLRSNDAVSAAIPAISLVSPQPNSDFMRQLRSGLDAANVSIVDGGANSALLQISGERFSSQPVSVNPRARAAQYELRLEVDISLSRDNQALIAPETLFTERSLFEDIENISGNREEIELLTDEMRRELVNQLLRRLASTGP